MTATGTETSGTHGAKKALSKVPSATSFVANAVTAFPAVILILGALQAYLRNGRSFVTALGQDWPWLVLTLVLLLAFCSLVWRRALSVARTKAFHDWSKNADDRVESVTQQAASQFEHYEKRIDDLKNQILAATSTRDSALSDAREYHQLLKYGRTLIETHIEDTHDFAAMRNSLQQLLPGLERLSNASERIWPAIVSLANEVEPDSPLGDALTSFSQVEVRHSTNAVRMLLETLRTTDRDARPLIEVTYTTYRVWRARLVAILGYLGKDLRDLPNYAEWRGAESEYFGELKKVAATRLLSVVQRQMNAFDQSHGSIDELVRSEVPGSITVRFVREQAKD